MTREQRPRSTYASLTNRYASANFGRNGNTAGHIFLAANLRLRHGYLNAQILLKGNEAWDITGDSVGPFFREGDYYLDRVADSIKDESNNDLGLLIGRLFEERGLPGRQLDDFVAYVARNGYGAYIIREAQEQDTVHLASASYESLSDLYDGGEWLGEAVRLRGGGTYSDEFQRSGSLFGISYNGDKQLDLVFRRDALPIVKKNTNDDPVPRSLLAPQTFSLLGSSLGNYLAEGSISAGVVYSSVLGEIGERLGQAIAGGYEADLTTWSLIGSEIQEIGLDVWQRMEGAAIGSVSSFLAAELGHALGLRGFGAELFQTASSSVLSTVIANVRAPQPTALFANLRLGKTTGEASSGVFGGASNALGTAVGSFLGAKLGSLLVNPQTGAGAVLSSIGSSIGGWAIMSTVVGKALGASILSALHITSSTIGNILLPGVGTFVGFVLGALIGNLFGAKKPREQYATAETVLQVPFARYELGTSSSSNAGHIDLVKSMAETARDTLNGIIVQVTGGDPRALVSNTNGAFTDQRYGHTYTPGAGAQQLYVTINGVRTNFDSADRAVNHGVLTAIAGTKVVGGDLFAKRALSQIKSPVTDLTQMAGNLQLAADYRFYAGNRELIEGFIVGGYNSLTDNEKAYYEERDGSGNWIRKHIIDRLQLQGYAALTSNEQAIYNSVKPLWDKISGALEDQSLANPWIITLARVHEMGLANWHASDFNGGLRGFLGSFDLRERGLGYENISFGWEGGPARIAAVGTAAQLEAAAGLFTLLPSAQVNGRQVVIDNFFGQPLGFAGWDASVMHLANLGDWRGTGGGVYADGQGGDDIMLASGHGDNMSGGSGWDWIEGHGGEDTLSGGSENDVLLGGAGTDRLLGGAGDDYLAGGDGWDYVHNELGVYGSGGVFGEGGNDTLIDDGGVDYLSGGDGNDLLIIGEGGDFDAIEGGAGSDTLSFERWSTGVGAGPGGAGDMRFADPPSSWGPGLWQVFGNSVSHDVENLTGSRFNDYLITDDGAVNRVLKGNDGDDTLATMGGNDTIEGGAGADAIHDYGGFDYASYESSASGVIVDLTSLTALGGDAEGDRVFEGIEALKGSRFADDLKGNAGYNVLEGGTGDDLLAHSAGGDRFEGGEGFDVIDYSGAGGAVYVGNAAGAGSGFEGSGGWAAAGQGWNSIEGFIGSAYGDNLNGGSKDEMFHGRGGNDYLTGGLGSDTYVYGVGDGVDEVFEDNSGGNVISLSEGVTYTDMFQGQQGGGTGFLQIGIRNPTAPNYILAHGNFGPYPIENKNKIKTLDMGGASQLDIGAIDGGASGSDYADVIYGGNNRFSMIIGNDGADTIYADQGTVTAGGIGSDGANHDQKGNVIVAGGGDDWIESAIGDDQYAMEYGHGRDTIRDTGGSDILAFGPTVKAEDVIFEVVGYDLYIGVREANAPSLRASQVSTWARIINGGVQYVNASGDLLRRANTIEFVQAGGAWIDLMKDNMIPWANRTVTTPGDYLPIVFDLQGDGVDLIPVADSDIVSRSENGVLTKVGWVGPADGLLAVDRNRDGKIDRASEISFVSDKAGAKTDLEGLAGWDSNGDGVLDKGDARWGELLVWTDENQNGRSTKKELKTLDEAGITKIDLKGKSTGFTAADTADSFVQNTTSFTRADGTTGTAYDVALARRYIHSDDLATGPEAKGDGEFGQLKNDAKKVAKDKKGGGEITYDDVKKEAEIDFTDHDKTAKKDEDRWKVKLDKDYKAYKGEKIMFGDEATLDVIKRTESSLKRAERDRLTRQVMAGRVLPLVFDLDGDGADLVAPESSPVTHDVNGDGVADRIGWVGADDAMLALDRNSDGSVQLTSEISFVGDKPGAGTDLEGLAAFDSDGDGALTAADTAFASFLLWRDLNQDGVSQAGELQTLTEAGFTRLELTARDRATDNGVVGENQVLGRTTASRDAVIASKAASDEGASPAKSIVGAPPRGLTMATYPSAWGAQDADGTINPVVPDPATSASEEPNLVTCRAEGSIVDVYDVAFGITDAVQLEEDAAEMESSIDAEPQRLSPIADPDSAPMSKSPTGSGVPITLQTGEPTVNDDSLIQAAMDQAADYLARTAPASGDVWTLETVGQPRRSLNGSGWWRTSDDDQTPGEDIPALTFNGEPLPPEDLARAATQQQSLRQALAGFGRDAGASAAVWKRGQQDGASPLAAANDRPTSRWAVTTHVA